MKYVITIDTDKRSVTASSVKPTFLRTGAERPEELLHRAQAKCEWENTTISSWLWEGVEVLAEKMNAKTIARIK